MTSKGKLKKLKTLTEDAIETVRNYSWGVITREYLEQRLNTDKQMASRVISALQKKHILGKAHNQYDADSYARATRFPITGGNKKKKKKGSRWLIRKQSSFHVGLRGKCLDRGIAATGSM